MFDVRLFVGFVIVFIWLGGKIWEDRMKLTDEFVASVATKNFIEPARIGLGVLCCNDFDDVALLKLGFEVDHFAIYNGASTPCADFAM